MNKIFSLLLILCIFSTVSCDQKTVESEDSNTEVKATENTSTDSNDINVYYFHSKRRCMTCKAIEENAKMAVGSLEKANFKSLDFTDEKNYDLAKEYGIVSSSLIIESKGKKVDLTDFAFQNAVTNPKALKDKIKVEVNGMVK